MDKISAVIITFNASETIVQCLEALNKVADEIIVIDSFSTDNTVELCRSKNAQVFLQQWLGYGPQKNCGIDKAANNFILSIDADEILDETLVNSILTEKQKGLKGTYSLRFKHFYYTGFAKYGAEGNEYKLRLFDKRMIGWNKNEVHESLVLPTNTTPLKLKGCIQHYSYKSIEFHVTKANNYTTKSALDLYNRNKTNYLFKMIFSPPVNFFTAYFLRLGFLDGINGLVRSVFIAHAAFLKNAKLWEMIKNKKSKQ